MSTIKLLEAFRVTQETYSASLSPNIRCCLEIHENEVLRLITDINLQFKELMDFTCSNSLLALTQDPPKAKHLKKLLSIENRALLDIDANILNQMMHYPLARTEKLMRKGLRAVINFPNPFENRQKTSERKEFYPGNITFEAFRFYFLVEADLFSKSERKKLEDFAISLARGGIQYFLIKKIGNRYKLSKNKIDREDLEELEQAFKGMNSPFPATSFKIQSGTLWIRNPSSRLRRALDVLIINQNNGWS